MALLTAGTIQDKAYTMMRAVSMDDRWKSVVWSIA